MVQNDNYKKHQNQSSFTFNTIYIMEVFIRAKYIRATLYILKKIVPYQLNIYFTYCLMLHWRTDFLIEKDFPLLAVPRTLNSHILRMSILRPIFCVRLVFIHIHNGSRKPERRCTDTQGSVPKKKNLLDKIILSFHSF